MVLVCHSVLEFLFFLPLSDGIHACFLLRYTSASQQYSSADSLPISSITIFICTSCFAPTVAFDITVGKQYIFLLKVLTALDFENLSVSTLGVEVIKRVLHLIIFGVSEVINTLIAFSVVYLSLGITLLSGHELFRLTRNPNLSLIDYL